MLCQHYKDALVEAASSGAEPRGDLRAHLDACLFCRAAFEQEQALFACIDTGLHVTANAEVPASLLPRLRARLDEESAPRRSWLSNRLVLASAAAMVVAFFAARAVWRPDAVERPVENAGKTGAPPQLTPSPQNPAAVITSPVAKGPSSQRQLAIAKSRQPQETAVGGKTAPEVLVPRDQEVLLAEYAEQWRLHTHPLLVAQEFDTTIFSPLQVAPIQIDELGVKPLAEEKLQ